MMTVAEFAKNLWLWKCGLPENPEPQIIPLEQRRKSQWNDRFELLMRNRLLMGSYRYGIMGKQPRGGYDHVASVLKRLGKYVQTGNQEHLVDSANLLLEFDNPCHPMAHMAAVDDGEHSARATR